MNNCQSTLDEYQLGSEPDLTLDTSSESESTSDTENDSNSASSFDTFENPFDGGATPDPDLDNLPELRIDPVTNEITVENDNPTVPVLWNQAIREAVIENVPGPTIASRAYAILNTAIYDAYAAYEGRPISTQLGDVLQRPESENTEANKTEAISYAAYQAAIQLFPEQQEIFAQLMEDLGFDPNVVSFDPTTAAGIGNISAQALLQARSQDGSNSLGDDPNGDGTPFSDTTGFTSVNSPDNLEFVDRFQLQNVPTGDGEFRTQESLTPQWGGVDGFALESGDQFRPGPPIPFIKEGVEATVNFDQKTITLADGTEVEISRDLIGSIINEDFIEQAEDIIEVSANLTDEQKIVAEFFEDGGGSSFPPGNSLIEGEIISARDNNTLDEDIQLFFALGNSQLDAGIAAWDAKTFYDYARPVTAIRGLGELGLIGEFDEDLGGYAIEAYAGPGNGTQRILATDFISYQLPGADLSPPFAEYVSGHSTFSAAAGEVLREFTGSDDFGVSVDFAPNSSRFEPEVTPGEDGVSLEFDTFDDWADGSGISRIYGGIHWEQGDLEGRALGRRVGIEVIDAARNYINGVDPTQDFTDESFAPSIPDTV